MTIRDVLRRIRNKASLGQKELAQALGISQSLYSKYETENPVYKDCPTLSQMSVICRHCKVSAEDELSAYRALASESPEASAVQRVMLVLKPQNAGAELHAWRAAAGSTSPACLDKLHPCEDNQMPLARRSKPLYPLTDPDPP